MLTMVLDRRGQIIAQSQSRPGGQQINLGHLPIVGEALRGRFDRHDLELDGEQFMAALVSIPQMGWTVLVAQPRPDALRPFRQASGYSLPASCWRCCWPVARPCCSPAAARSESVATPTRHTPLPAVTTVAPGRCWRSGNSTVWLPISIACRRRFASASWRCAPARHVSATFRNLLPTGSGSRTRSSVSPISRPVERCTLSSACGNRAAADARQDALGAADRPRRARHGGPTGRCSRHISRFATSSTGSARNPGRGTGSRSAASRCLTTRELRRLSRDGARHHAAQAGGRGPAAGQAGAREQPGGRLSLASRGGLADGVRLRQRPPVRLLGCPRTARWRNALMRALLHPEDVARVSP
jgi:hypothetical protein